MAFDPKFLEELRHRVSLPGIIGRRTKLVRSGRNWKACCPFHGEKTPSFYVYEDHFHCYGCGAHGDVISFIMQSEGRSFSEVIHELAALVGLDVPEQTQRQKEQQQSQQNLYELLSAAQKFYSQQLDSLKGKSGKSYLFERGLSVETIHQFKLGWSGSGRGELIAFLKEQGFTLDLMGEAGLLRHQEEGKWGGELFFNRIIFPICDRRGRVIAFGGRLIGEGQPKYLNSPETPLFSKRRILFGLNQLSELSVNKREENLQNTILVVEGYMDVIALYQAGFKGAVAPLGTALTQEQLNLLWQSTSKPVLCFDGDDAGRRAMLHAAEEALPLLTPEKSLDFITLPEGEDPDSFIRHQGKEAFLENVRFRRNLSTMIYQLLTEAMLDNSPEQRAALRNRLIAIAGQIQNNSLSKEYRKSLLDQFYAQFYQRIDFSSSSHRSKQKDFPFKPSLRPLIRKEQVDYERMRILTAMLLQYPELLPNVEEAFCKLDLPRDLSTIREALIELPSSITQETLQAYLTKKGLEKSVEKVLNSKQLKQSFNELHHLSFQELEKQWWHFYSMFYIKELEKQVAQARNDWELFPDQAHQKALLSRIKALELARRGEIED